MSPALGLELGMRMRFTCSQGHQWVSSEAGADGEAPPCPICISAEPTSGQVAALPPTEVGGSVRPRALWPALPGYDLLEPLGGGGMGEVYKARQLSLDRLVAIKVIRPERLAERSAAARFLREARAAARLTHPNIVAVFDAAQAAD